MSPELSHSPETKDTSLVERAQRTLKILDQRISQEVDVEESKIVKELIEEVIDNLQNHESSEALAGEMISYIEESLDLVEPTAAAADLELQKSHAETIEIAKTAKQTAQEARDILIEVEKKKGAPRITWVDPSSNTTVQGIQVGNQRISDLVSDDPASDFYVGSPKEGRY